jgi:drug/metabolite transporter (DMT)-like permease
MSQDRPVLGIFLMLGFCLFAPLGDALAKLLGGQIDVAQMVAIRMGVQAVVLLPVVFVLRLSLTSAFGRIRLITLRAVLHMLGIGLMFLSLRYLPLADAIAIAFVMPFIMLLLGRFVLDEEVGSRRLIACLVGFVGTLLVMQPSFAEVGWPALLPVGVAFIFAFFMLTTRQLAKDVDAVTLQMVSGVLACVILIPILLVLTRFEVPGFQITTPATGTWGLVLAMGLLGTTAHLLMTSALKFAPSATLAPMQYLEIPVAALLGWMVFQDFPNGLALLGIVITVMAGLYVIYREQKLSRSKPRLPDPDVPAE